MLLTAEKNKHAENPVPAPLSSTVNPKGIDPELNLNLGGGMTASNHLNHGTKLTL
jgi:hypothetical protein